MSQKRSHLLPALSPVLIAALLGACSGTSSLPSLFAAKSEPEPQAAALAGPMWALVALRPVIGTSPAFAETLTREMNERSKARTIALLTSPTAQADTTLVGYFTLRKTKNSAVVEFIWDVLEANGGLRNRVSGTQTVALPKTPGDVWSELPPTITAFIADKAFEALGTNLPKSNITTASIDKVERK